MLPWIEIKMPSATLYLRLSSLANYNVYLHLQKDTLTNHLNLNTVLEVGYSIQNIVIIYCLIQ